MQTFNDSNWTGRTPRTLQETRLGPYGSWSAYNKQTLRQGRIRLVARVIGWALGLSLAFTLILNIDRVSFFFYRSFS